jgi:hypothetical protein
MSMKLIFLHGAPATGKLTIAKALLGIVSGRLFDNHAAIDLARTIFDFGAPGFWELVHELRLAALDAAARHRVPLVVATFCFSEPGDRPQFAEFEALMQRHGAELIPAFLHCSDEEIGRRIGGHDRAERGKITSMEELRQFRAACHDSPVPRADCIMLDTAARSAEETAQEIARHFGLVDL